MITAKINLPSAFGDLEFCYYPEQVIVKNLSTSIQMAWTYEHIPDARFVPFEQIFAVVQPHVGICTNVYDNFVKLMCLQPVLD